MAQADHLDAVPQHVERPAIVELLAQSVENGALSRNAVRRAQRLPRLRLRPLDPSDEVGREQGAGAVVDAAAPAS